MSEFTAHPGPHEIRAQRPVLCLYCREHVAKPGLRGYCSEFCEEMHRDMRDDARGEETGS